MKRAIITLGDTEMPILIELLRGDVRLHEKMANLRHATDAEREADRVIARVAEIAADQLEQAGDG